MLASRFASAALVSAVALSSAAAQNSGAPGEHIPSEFERRSSGSISFTQSRCSEASNRTSDLGTASTARTSFDSTGLAR